MRRTVLPYVPLKTLFLSLCLFLFVRQGEAQCTVSTFPYTDLNTDTLPSCWSATAGSGAAYLWSATASDGTYGATAPQTGTGFAFLNVYFADVAHNTYNLTSPSIVLPAGVMQLSYYYFLGTGGYQGTTGSSGGDPYPLSVLISTNGGTSWTDIYDHSASNSTFATSNSSPWSQNIISLAPYANQTILIQFVSNSNYGSGVCNQGINQVMVSTPPPCLGTPSAITLGAQTGSNAVIHWTDASPTPSNGYNWIVVPSGAGSTATPVVSGTNLVGDDSTLITGLSPLISYDYYIQTFCGGASLGTWAGPLTFTQPCGSISTFPYIALNSGSLAACWTTSAGAGATYQWAPTTSDPNYGAVGPQNGTYFMYLYVFLAQTGYNTYNLTSPLFALPSSPQNLSYYYYLGTNGYQGTTGSTGTDPYPLAVQISTDSGVTWTDIYDHSSANSTFASTNAVTNWTQNNISLSAYANQVVQIRFVSNSNYGSGYCDQGLDQFSIATPPACAGAPTLTSATNLTYSSGVIRWTDATPTPASGYNWIVVPQGAGSTATPVASGTSAVGDDSTLVTGLSASTSYDYYIQSNCGGIAGVGSWAGPLTFTTPCAAISLPLAEGFNSTTQPNCWSQQYVTGTNNLQYVASSTLPTTTPQEGSDYVLWDSYFIFSGETRLVSPPITSVGVSSVDVSFYWYNEHSNFYNSGRYLNEGVKVQYSLDGINFTDVQFYPREDASFAIGTGAWRQKYLTLPLAVANQSQFYVGFSFVSEDGDNCSFDHLNIFPSLPCAGGASAITASNLVDTGATISWTAAPIPPSNGYNWVVVAAGDSATSPTPIATGSTAAGVDSFIITSLSPSTSYDVYVQSNCGGTGLGYWSGPGSFHTPCAAVTSLPWTEGFEGLGTNVGLNILPPCWAQAPYQRWTSRDAPFTFPVTIPAHTGTNYITDYYNAKDTLLTPGFALTGGVAYEFYYYYQTDGNQGWDSIKTMYGSGQSSAGMSTLIGSTIYSPQNTTYNKFTAVFTPATSGTYYFGVNVNATFQPYVIAFDDFGLKIAPPCPIQVSNFVATNLTPNTATLSWSATANPGSGFNWELVAHGDSVNGTILYSGTTLTGVDSVIATGLLASTSYDLYVQANCGGGLGAGDWGGPLEFTTPCAAITSLPWHEGFEGLGTNTGTDLLPPCWLPTPRQRWATSHTPFTFPVLGPRGGNNFLYDRYNSNDTVFTPGFALTAGTQYEFYFYYETDGYTGWDSIYAMYGNYQTPAAMTTQIGTVVLGPTNTNYVKYSAIFTPATTGTYYFGVKLSSSFNPYDLAFDDFGLQEVVPCPNPPTAGVITGPNHVCSGTSVNLQLTGYSPYTVLQWQSSSDSVTFSDIVGANQDVITTNVSSTSYFRVKVLCADSTYSVVFPIYVNSPIQCYCNTNLGGYCGNYNIDTLSILATGFDVTNAPCTRTASGEAYTAFPDTGSATTTLQRGGTYSIYIGIEAATYSTAWIDFNQDGAFAPSEGVQLTNYAVDGTASITIPTNANLGLTGFRVRTSSSFFGQTDTNTACTYLYDGETFDFHVTIVDTACSVAPTILDTIANVSCNGGSNGSIALTISGAFGPYTNLWSNGDTSAAITNLTAGRYADTIRYDFGCQYVWNVDTVAQPAVLTASTDSIKEVKCFGVPTGAIYVSASGGTLSYSNHWSSGETTQSLTGKASGIYTDTITDAHGCSVIVGPDTITQPASALSLHLDSTHNVTCNGLSNGAAYITVTGGTAPYAYNWTNSTSARNLLNVPAGPYTVNVTDTNGCTTSVSDTITQPAVLTIITDSVIDTKCHTSSDGSIYVHVTGGTQSYSYTWTGGSHSFNLFLKPAGVYTLVVTDANNCSATATDTITSPALLSVASSITNQIQNGALGAISTTVSGGVAPFSYHWNNGDSTSSLSNLTAGVYKVTVTDKNGCTTSQIDTVNFIPDGINEISGDVKDFNVYPNPSSGLFNVLVELSHTVPVQLEIYAITGQQIPAMIQQSPLNNTYQLDLSDQPSGVYLIKLTAGDYSVVKRVTLVK